MSREIAGKYRNSKAITEYKEFPGRSHFTVGQDGREEVADYALTWSIEHAVIDRSAEQESSAGLGAISCSGACTQGNLGPVSH